MAAEADGRRGPARAGAHPPARAPSHLPRPGTITGRRPLLVLPFLTACGPSEDERRRAFIYYLRTRSAAPPRDYGTSITPFDRRLLDRYAADWDVIGGFHDAAWRGEETLTAALRRVGQFPPMPTVTGPPTFVVMEMQQLLGLRDALQGYREEVRRVRAALAQLQARTDARRAALRQPEDLAAAYEAAYERMVRGWVRAHEAYYAALEISISGDVRLAETYIASPDRVQASAEAAVTADTAVQARLEEVMREGEALGEASREAARRRREYLDGR